MLLSLCKQCRLLYCDPCCRLWWALCPRSPVTWCPRKRAGASTGWYPSYSPHTPARMCPGEIIWDTTPKINLWKVWNTIQTKKCSSSKFNVVNFSAVSQKVFFLLEITFELIYSWVKHAKNLDSKIRINQSEKIHLKSYGKQFFVVINILFWINGSKYKKTSKYKLSSNFHCNRPHVPLLNNVCIWYKMTANWHISRKSFLLISY